MEPREFGNPGVENPVAGLPEEDSFEQREIYTCGPAVFRKVLSILGIQPPPESNIASIMGTTEELGTPLGSFKTAAHKFGLEYLAGHNGTIEHLGELLGAGHTVVAEYTIPEEGKGHFAIILKIVDGKVHAWQPDGHYVMDPVYDIEEFKALWLKGHRHHGAYGGWAAFKKQEQGS